MRKIKTIFAGALAAAMSCSLCIPVSAADEQLKLITTTVPFDIHGNINEGIYAVANNENDQIIRISIDDIAAFQESGELSYSIVVEDCSEFFDYGGNDGIAWFGDQYFRNGYAQFVKFNANNEQICKYIVYFDGEELSIIDEFTDYRCVSPNGYISRFEGTQYITAIMTDTHGAESSTAFGTFYDCTGFIHNNTVAVILTGEYIETTEIEGCEWTKVNGALNLIDENCNTTTLELGEAYGYTKCIFGENYAYIAEKTDPRISEKAAIYLYDNGDRYTIDLTSLGAAAQSVLGDFYNITASSLYACGDRAYNGIIAVAFKANSTSAPYWALVDLNADGKAISDVYQYMDTKDGEIYLVQDLDGKWGYIDSNGEELKMFDDAGDFIGDYAPVIKNGKAYLIDRGMNIVSNGIKADAVSTFDDGLYRCEIDGKELMITYTLANESTEDKPVTNETTEEPVINETTEDEPVAEETVEDRPADDTPAVDTEAPTDTDKGGSPDTGANGIAAAAALSIVALGAVMLSRKNR